MLFRGDALCVCLDQGGGAVAKIDQDVRGGARVHDSVNGACELAVFQRGGSGAGLAREAGEPDRDAGFSGGGQGQIVVLLRFRRAVDEGERRHDGWAGEGHGRGGVSQGLGGGGGVEHAEAGTAKPFRHEQAGQTEIGQAVPEVFLEAMAGFGQCPQPLHRQAVFEEVAQGVIELALFQAETEFHQPLPIVAWVWTFGSRGRSRPRSPMMFFWMLLDPPPIIRPTSYM